MSKQDALGAGHSARVAQGEKRRSDMIAFIVEYQEKHGFPPSIRAIGNAVGLTSTGTIHRHMLRLEQDGKIKRKPFSWGYVVMSAE